MLRAIERGLSLVDFNSMTPGMIIGYIVCYNNEHLKDEGTVREATQTDFDCF